MTSMSDLIPVLPELFLACAGMALLMLGVFYGKTADGDSRSAEFINSLTIIVFILTALLVMAYNISLSDGGSAVSMGGLYLADAFGGFIKLLVLLASIFALVMAGDYLKLHGLFRFEYPILVLFAVLGMMVMVSAGSLMSLYLGLELQSLSLYVIAAFSRNSLRSSEAGLKYFVLGALASGMLLYGASLIYGFSGSMDFEVLAVRFADPAAVPVGVLVGLMLLLAGLAFKISAVPFHMWTPDVYEGAPTPVTAFFALAPKIAAMGLLLRVLTGPFGDMAAQWQQVITFIAVASMILGAFAAIAQTNIKRLMAYSSIGHMGYALIGLAAGSEEGVRGVLIYISVYLFMNAGAFACILAMRRGDRMTEDIADLAGLGKRQPLMALLMAVFMFSLAGIPPLAGFFGKFYVFLAAVNADLYGLALLGLLASVVGAFYYLRVVKVMYFDKPAEHFDRPLARSLVGVMAIAGVVTLFFWLYPTPILSEAGAAAAALFSG